MTTNVSNNTGGMPDTAAIRREALVVLRGFAFAYANGRTYGLAHKITRQAVAMSEKALASFQSQYGALDFAVDASGFHIAGAPVDLHTAGLDALSARLVELGASGISFEKGVPTSELDGWFALLSTGRRSPGGFQALLSSAGLARIHATSFAFRKVGRDEDVAKKTAIASPKPHAPTPAQGIRLAPLTPPSPIAPAAPTPPSPDASSAARQRNATPIRTARRLLDSLPPGAPLPPLKIDIAETAIHRDLVEVALPSDASVGGRSPDDLADETGDRLERLADGIMAHPANQTQTGRAALRKFLKEAGSDLTERLQRLGADIQALERLAAKVRDLVEDLAVDGIVTRLVKLSGQMTADENRLVRRLRHADRVGGEEGSRRLQARLREAGLTEDMLQQLLDAARREKTSGGKGDGRAEDATTVGGGVAPQDSEEPSPLPSLLDQLKETDPGSGDLPHLIENIIEEMNQTLLRTEERVRKQLRTLHSLMDGRSEKKTISTTELTREELIRLMAELGQQLKQPLTVVTGAAQMIHSGYFGKVSKEEKTALRLINDSTDELDLLVERMIEIAHLPDTLQPEREVIDKFKNAGKHG